MDHSLAIPGSNGDGPLGRGGSERPAPLISNGRLGMLTFVIAETMMFAGLISAFEIMRASAMVWPPPNQPRLPVEETALNTAALVASGLLLIVAGRAFRRGNREGMLRPLWAAVGLGAFFVVFQGMEWVSLLSDGLTLTSSALGSFFYLIVGMHALHAIGAIGLLAYACLQLQRGWLTESLFGAAEVFWLFVVGVWPVLYWVVYL